MGCLSSPLFVAFVLFFLCIASGNCLSYGLEKRSVTDETQLDYATIEILLRDREADPALLRRLTHRIEENDYSIHRVIDIIAGLPNKLYQQLIAANIIAIENSLRNRLDDYQLILQEIRYLHANMSNYDNETFTDMAGNIQRNLDKLIKDVSDSVPDDLRTLDRNLRGETVAGSPISEGAICDVAVSALRELKHTRDLTATVRDGPVAMLDGLILVQELSTDLLLITCASNDPVCLARVAQFRQHPQRQRDQLAECIPPWMIYLAKDDVVAGRLQLSPENKALTLVAVHFLDTDLTDHFPELHDRQEGAQQLVVLERFGSYYRLVIGESCYVTLHNQEEFHCSFPNTGLDALFAVETTREGDTWLYNVQTQRYLVAGERREPCREDGLALSQQRGAPWTLDSSFSPGSGFGEIRRCDPSPPTTIIVENGADRPPPGVTSLVLSLLTAALLAARPTF